MTVEKGNGVRIGVKLAVTIPFLFDGFVGTGEESFLVSVLGILLFEGCSILYWQVKYPGIFI